MIKLEVLNTAHKGKKLQFKDWLTIGNGPKCTLRAQSDGLMEVHAKFIQARSTNKATVETACKEAHIFVNGKDVMRAELRHGDEVVVGPLRFRVIDDGMVSASALKIDQLVESLGDFAAQEVYDFAREDLFYLITKDPTLREALSFSIPSKDRFIEQAQIFLARLVKQSGMQEPRVEAFMTCAKELILNAHRHGHQLDESKKIVIRYRDLGDRVQLSIEDEGKGFDHKSLLEAVRQKNAAASARERYKAGGVGGLGFQMITKMAQDLAYNQVGNVVTYSVLKDLQPKPKQPSGSSPERSAQT